MDDVIIIGAGWSGLAAAVFAFQRGLKFRLIAQGVGSVIITPGWISVWDSAPDDDLDAAIRALNVPDHPYTLTGADAVRDSLQAFGTFITGLGLPFQNAYPRRLTIPTALGSPAHPAASLLHAPSAEQRVDAVRAVLYVGFNGWRDYYPRLSGARAVSVDFPDMDRPWDATATDLARALDSDSVLQQLATSIQPHLNGASAIALPAALGLDRYDCGQRLAKIIGRPVYEIPTLPPAVAGTRLFNALRRRFFDEGIRVLVGHPVLTALKDGNGAIIGVEVGAAGKPTAFRARHVIFAGGGLYGGGLFSDDRGRIWEQVFNLPVDHIPDRTAWFESDPLALRGHPVHRFGVRVDDHMRPVGTDGAIVDPALQVIGKMIRQPDDKRAPAPLEAAEGVALASAFKAIQSIAGT